MSAALVVVATITLVIGLLGTGLTLIYVSIGCSVLAGIVLAVAVMRGRPERSVSAPTMARPVVTPPTPTPTPASSSSAQPGSEWEPPRPSPAPEPRVPVVAAPGREEQPAGVGAVADATGAPAVAHSSAVARLRERARARGERQASGTEEHEAVADAGESTAAMAAVAEVDSGAEGFPIADYDQLRASEILRRLPDLSPEELEAVREHEAAGMNRFTVVSRIDAVLAESGHRWEVSDEEWSAEEEREREHPWAAEEAEEWPADEEEAPAPEAPQQEAPTAEVLDFRFEDEYEPSGAAERLAARMAARHGGGDAGADMSAARKSAARQTAAKRSSAKKAPAKKAPAKKAAAKKAPARKAPAKKAAGSAAWVEPSGDVCPSGHPVKAKVRSGIYHVEGGRDYERTSPDRCYRDEASAKRDGLRRAKR